MKFSLLRPGPGGSDRRRSGGRWSTHAATVGLVLVLLVLTVFSVSAAVLNARAAQEARRSADVSAWSDRAQSALPVMEDAADERAAGSDGLASEDYEAASAAVSTALREMAAADAQQHRGVLDDWLALHARYRLAVQSMIALDARDPQSLEHYEDAYVDPHYDALENLITDERHEHSAEARAELATVARLQRLLLVTTPVLFGIGLVLLGLCTAVLARSRRETAVQADRNRRQALHDALTGLPNRELLAQRLIEALADEGSAALLLVDLDRFREVNDTLGHHLGDALLLQVGPRLAGALRATDTVARLGGDEFAVLLPDVDDLDAALTVAHALQAALESPFLVEHAELHVEASIGVVLSGRHGASPVELVQHADTAMYTAKQRHLGVAVYDPDSDGHTPARLALLGDLRRAVGTDELFLLYQPKVHLSTGQVCGAEALVRWRHPVLGLVPPDDFIPLAEGTGLIGPLTTRVLDLALAQARRWADAGTPVQVAVNLSARNLLDDRLDALVQDRLLRHGVPAALLKLEVTESAIMTDPARAKQVLQRLHEQGIALSIDDFGAGYTSLGQLKDLPIDELKVDRSFVTGMGSDLSDRTIVRSVVELGHNLGLSAVAEGVEDEAVLGLLAALGCDVAQGYHLSRPLTADAFDAWRARAVPLVPSRQPAG